MARAYIQAGGAIEERLASQYLKEQGFELKPMSLKKFTRQIDFNFRDIAVGNVPFLKRAAAHLGKRLPFAIPYPEGSEPYWNRDIQMVSTANIKFRDIFKENKKLFLKEGGVHKGFSGVVSSLPKEFFRSEAGHWYISEVKEMTHHCRIYYINRECRYAAWDTKAPDLLFINKFIKELPLIPLSGSFDLAKIDGEWSLVEFNDGFSIGAYNAVPADIYGEMLLSRWQELYEKIGQLTTTRKV